MKVLDFDIFPKMFSTNQNALFSKLQYSGNNGAMKLVVYLMTRKS